MMKRTIDSTLIFALVIGTSILTSSVFGQGAIKPYIDEQTGKQDSSLFIQQNEPCLLHDNSDIKTVLGKDLPRLKATYRPQEKRLFPAFSSRTSKTTVLRDKDRCCEPSLFNSLIYSHPGNTLYVGGYGPGNYSKIQYAVENATSGDTIYVYSKIY